MKHVHHMRPSVVALAFGCLICAGNAEAVDSATVKSVFANPPREYSTGPLWTWNDLLTEEQIVATLRDLAAQKVRQVWVHPRPGLMTPYLSDDWFRLWKAALREAERLDMNVWIYDENSYPSGFAGGLVPEAMPESRGRGLHFREETQPSRPGDDVLGIFRLGEDDYQNVTRQARNDEGLPEGRYLVAYVRRSEDSPWYAGKCYVDLLYPGVTEKFLEITLEAYRREVGDQFGKRIPGVFTDEPQLRPAGGLPWTDHLPDAFQRRWGYSLIDCLPSLTQPLGDWRRVRHNYYQVVLEQFIEHWGKPYYQYCEQHDLELTGHYWEHEWPRCVAVPDNMAMAAWQQRPGIDVLFNNYTEGPHAQFGNVRAVKEIASIANQLGRRTLSETYAGTGWENRFEDTKRIADWQYALGLNTLNECLSFVTIRGVRKGDYPQSLSYHNPWWEAYHQLAGYFTRLSAALSQGDEINPTLILEPTSTAWMYQGEKDLEPFGVKFQDLVNSLARDQVPFDLGCENVLADHGSVAAGQLTVGRRQYSTVVLPPLTENVNAATMDLLESYLESGGKVLCCGTPPTRIDGRLSDRGERAAQRAGWSEVDASRLAEVLLIRSQDGFAIRRDPQDGNLFFHHRRQLDDGDLVFLVNTSIDRDCTGVVMSSALGVERWDPETGNIRPHPFEKTEHGVRVSFRLPPCGSLLLFLSDEPGITARPPSGGVESISPVSPLVIRRLEPNVLTLDYLDVSAGGETRRNLYSRRASEFVFATHGFDRNPWFHAFQFRDEFIARRFPPESGFSATYRFAIRESVPHPLEIAIERPDLYTITCNGEPVSPTPDSWWLDRACGKVDIAAAAKVGENEVTILASPFTMFHELEPAYVLGDFAVEPADSGFVISPDVPIRLSGTNATHGTAANGTMWLSAGIDFSPAPPALRQRDTAPFLVFDLGHQHTLQAIRVFNYNEPNWTRLGAKRVRITGSTEHPTGPFALDLGTFDLAEAPGDVRGSLAGKFPVSLAVDAKEVRYVRFDILSNHNDVVYPNEDASKFHGIVGLSEARFLAPSNDGNGPTPIAGVTIANCSSELSVPGVCDRRARYVVDGSGLERGGWKDQGLPFYAAGVSYSQRFDVARPSGRYHVRLLDWYGSVTKVIVNGTVAGYIGYRPWRSDVTHLLQPGSNTVEVVVIGTLKNTLGPHHAGQRLGVMGPHDFQKAPETGPPPGVAYRTVGYGLYEPFVLEHERQ